MAVDHPNNILIADIEDLSIIRWSFKSKQPMLFSGHNIKEIEETQVILYKLLSRIKNVF